MSDLPQYKPRLSHSAITAFKTCNELHYLRYIKRIKPKTQGASLAFGSCIDQCTSYLLLAHQSGTLDNALMDYMEVFVADPEKGWNLSFDSDSSRYGAKDLDSKLIQTDECRGLIQTWELELQVNEQDAINAYKQRNHKEVKDNEFKMHNRLSWLSMREKGRYMMQAFIDDVLPQIEEVVAVQDRIDGETGDSTVVGFIDLIAKLKGHDKYVICDVKTAGMPYELEDVKMSEQLTFYTGVRGPELNTNLAGFIVLAKNIGSEAVCPKCMQKKETSHKTCNNEVNGKRCNAEWTSTLKGSSQILVDTIEPNQQQEYLDELPILEPVMRTGLRIKNFESCRRFGGYCDFIDLCRNGDPTNYIIPEEN